MLHRLVATGMMFLALMGIGLAGPRADAPSRGKDPTSARPSNGGGAERGLQPVQSGAPTWPEIDRLRRDGKIEEAEKALLALEMEAERESRSGVWLRARFARLELVWKRQGTSLAERIRAMEALQPHVPAEARPVFLLRLAMAYAEACDDCMHGMEYVSEDADSEGDILTPVPETGVGNPSGQNSPAGTNGEVRSLPEAIGWQRWSRDAFWKKVSGLLDEAFARVDERAGSSGADYGNILPCVDVPAGEISLHELLVRGAIRISCSWPHRQCDVLAIPWKKLASTPQAVIKALLSRRDTPIGRGLWELKRWMEKLENASVSTRLRAEGLQITCLTSLSPDDSTERLSASLYADLLRKYRGQPGMGPYYAEIANFWDRKGNVERAMKIAREGSECFRGEEGEKCRKLISLISEPHIEAKIPAASLPGPLRIRITYRNTCRLYARISRADWKSDLAPGSQVVFWKDMHVSPSSSIWMGKLSLPRPHLWRTCTHTLTLPALPAGQYRLELAAAGTRSQDGQHGLVARFQMSRLALAYTCREESVPAGQAGVVERIEGYTLGRIRNGAVAHAQVELWGWQENGAPSVLAQTRSDEDGAFSFRKVPVAVQYRMRIVDQADEVVSPFFMLRSTGKVTEDSPEAHYMLKLFSDRAVYRPGQIVHFKGICLNPDFRSGKAPVIPSFPVTLCLKDANGNEVERKTFETNGFGSFSGSFVLPENRLPGRWSLVSERPESDACIRVEYYRRPKIAMDLEIPRDARRSSSLEVKGRVHFLTGAPVEGARIRYSFRTGTLSSNDAYENSERSKEEILTGSDGTFRIYASCQDFDLADNLDSKGEIPCYSIGMDVKATAPSGETTRQEASVQILEGNCSLALEVPSASLRGPVVLKARTVDGLGTPVSSPVRMRLFRLLPTAGHEPDKWIKGRSLFRETASTSAAGTWSWTHVLAQGAYRVEMSIPGQNGKWFTATRSFMVWPAPGEALTGSLPASAEADRVRAHVGDVVTVRWARPRPGEHAILEVVHDGRVWKRMRSGSSPWAEAWTVPVTQELAGGFVINLLEMTAEGAVTSHFSVEVPFPGQTLDLKAAVDATELSPGEKGVVHVKVSGDSGNSGKPAEILGVMYDAALEAIAPHGWNPLWIFWEKEYPDDYSTVDEWCGATSSLLDGVFVESRTKADSAGKCGPPKLEYRVPADAKFSGMNVEVVAACFPFTMTTSCLDIETTKPGPPADIRGVLPRNPRNELAFFMPHIVAASGEGADIPFEAPQALTRWRFLAFAHTAEGASGMAETSLVTRKDFMALADWPRFLRAGDQAVLSASLLNRTKQCLDTRARLNLGPEGDPGSASWSVYGPLEQVVRVPSDGASRVAWRVTAPRKPQVVNVSLRAGSASLHDGEEWPLPVLSDRETVVDSVPLRFDGSGKYTIPVPKGWGEPESERMGVRVQAVTQPGWLVVDSLPYLATYPHSCAEQLFHRYYSLVLARHLAGVSPAVAERLEAWRHLDDPGAVPKDSLEQDRNASPFGSWNSSWAQDRKRTGERLMDPGGLQSARDAFAVRQLEDGSWEWFPGMRSDIRITALIVKGLGKLHRLTGMQMDPSAETAVNWLRRKLKECWEKKSDRAWADLRQDWEPILEALASVADTYPFPADDSGLMKASVEVWRAENLENANPGDMARIALAFSRLGEREVASRLAEALKQRQLRFPDGTVGWPGKGTAATEGDTPVSTLAAVLSVWEEVVHDEMRAAEVADTLMLRQRESHWSTTVETADALGALFNRIGKGLETPVRLSLGVGGRQVARLEGLGVQECLFPPETMDGGTLTLEREGPGLAWASVHFIQKRSAASLEAIGTGMALDRDITWLRAGKVLKKNEEPRPGDEALVNLTVRTSRPLEYVHLADPRAAGLEPENDLSGYRRVGNTWAYVSHQDGCTDLFFQRLEAGVHNVQYRVRVRHEGRFLTPPAEIRSMYSPEWYARSKPLTIEVAPPVPSEK